ncbi:MAG: peroxidase family protein [Thiobacillus sp.]|nr:peroxidase family protein [Thiobacillus sp.]
MAFYDFHVNLDDLKKILAQIKIAEAHAAFQHGTGPEAALVDLVSHSLAPEGLRTVSGIYNNLLPGQQDTGAADQVMPRLLQPLYRPAEFQPAGFFGPGSPAGTTQTSYSQNAGNVFDSQPRTISNLIVDQTPNNPAAIITALIVAGSADPYGDANLIAQAQQAAVDAPAAAAAAQAAEDAAIATATASAAAATAAATTASGLQAIAAADTLAAADAQALADAANQAVADALAVLTALQEQAAGGSAAVAAAQTAYDEAVAASDAADVLAASTAATATASADLATAAAGSAATLQAKATADLGWLNFAQTIQGGAQINQSNAATAAANAAAAESAALAARDAIDPLLDPAGWAAADAIYQQEVLDSNAADASLAAANTILTRADSSVASTQIAYSNSLAAATTATLVANSAQAIADADAQEASDAAAAAGLAQQAEVDALAILNTLIAGATDPTVLAAAQAAYDQAVADAVAPNQAAADAAAVAQASADAAAAAAADAATAQAQADVDAAAAAAATAASDAADAAVVAGSAAVTSLMSDLGIPVNEDGTIQINNLSPDIGLSPSFNGWMTLFGQFFDHGLDLIGKGGSGTVYIPLLPDDPLYVEGGHTNFMVLTRATNQPGPDGVLGTADDIHEHANSTTPFVDQNQTYTSHPSHQVFLREYQMVNGRPLATGHLLDGANGGIANWAEVKTQAADLLGIQLTDADIFNVPLLATDDYGEFIRGPNGFAQVVMRTAGGDGIMGTADDGTVLVEGNPAAPISVVDAIRTGHAFLDDIAHNAVPVFDVAGNLVADTDGVAGNPIETNPQTGARLEYDNELLDRHYITGDGRGNENIGLTAVHTIFHSEHNRLVEANKLEILASGDLAFINEWLLTDVTVIPAGPTGLNWDGERLFQAARFATEMEYQHLVFEEFARKIQPAIDPFVFSHSADLDPAIFAEFANVVYRFGHSMLNETVARLNPDGTPNDIGLIEAFLNPVEFDQNGAVTADEAAGAIIRGMTRQTGNEIDEFVIEALRNNLLGLPLDLPTINIARARDTGVPSFNDARAQFFEMTGDSRLAPYASWVDFGSHINNPTSIVNFIAAYGLHDTITGVTTLDEKRAAATLMVFGGPGAPADRLDFLNSTGIWTAANSGLNNIDLWIGGLAEEKQEFGGMLGSTFNFVFESQLENLQNGDRFYYLSRTQGMNMLNELENNTFTKLVMRNTDLGDIGMPHLPGILFDTANHILEMDGVAGGLQFTPDPTHDDPVLDALSPLVVRRDLDNDGDGDFLEYKGADHVVLGGTEEADHIIGGIGIDTLWGDGGNDRLDGGYEADKVFGGAGDDIITNLGGDDFLHGDDGNDVIHMGSGLVLGFGNAGSDFIMTGPDAQEIFAGEGNDFLLGNNGGDFLLGNAGDDWSEGGEGFDTLAGENSELFFNSPIIGHDVLNGQGNDTDYDGESGDDIMFQGAGVQRSNGMAGFDWAIHKGDPVGAISDLGIPIFVNQEQFILRDRFDLVEGLSGWNQNDILIGRNIVAGAIAANGAAAIFDPNDTLQSFSSVLLQESVDRIQGFDQLVAHLSRVNWTWGSETKNVVVLDPTAVQLDGNNVVTFVQDNPSDILLGGAGNDSFVGKAGNDIIDGDAWLNAVIRVNMPNPANSFEIDSLTEIQARMLTGEINPGQLEIVRRIEWADPATSSLDTAVYRDVLANYIITQNADGSYTVEHTVVAGGGGGGGGGGGANNLIIDGTDRLFNIERLLFADQEVLLEGGTITGTEGNDLLLGTAGNDTILGLGGSDIIDGQVGVDLLDGGTGSDTITGGPGNDTLLGGDGDDFLLGDDGDDTIEGGLGNDQMDGGAGNDILLGGDGDDLLLGSAGNDILSGGAGIDTLQGDDGDDTVTGGAGDDIIDTSLGNDVLVLGAGFGNDIVTGFDADAVGGQDRIDLSAFNLSLITFGSGVTIADDGSGTNTLVTVNGVDGGTILLVGVADPASVTVNDFVLV